MHMATYLRAEQQLAGISGRLHRSVYGPQLRNLGRAGINRFPLTRCVVTQATTAATVPNVQQHEFYSELLALSTDNAVVEVGSTSLGRGLVATADLVRQAAMSIPLHKCLIISDDPLTSVSVFGDTWQETWQQCYGTMPAALLEFLQGDARWDARLTAWVLWLAKQQNYDRLNSDQSRVMMSSAPNVNRLWQLYLQSLPQEECMTCLLNYVLFEEAQQLQIPELKKEALNQVEWLRFLHDHYMGPKGTLRDLQLSDSLAHTAWATSLVRSRTFSEEVGGEGITMMVPAADMANHAFNHNGTFCLSSDSSRFELRCIRATPAGSELSICYGENKTNLELMRDYGFVVPCNPNNVFNIPTATEQEKLPVLNVACLFDCLKVTGDWKKRELKPVKGGPWDSSQTGGDAAGQPPDQDRATAWQRRRCAVLSLPLSDGWQVPSEPPPWWMFEAKAWTPSGEPPPRPLDSNQMAGERQSIRFLLNKLQAVLATYPTSVDHDTALLKGDSCLTPRVHQAVVARLDHKLLVREMCHVLEEYAQHLACM